MIKRRLTRQVSVGNIPIGSSSPISVQSMTNTKTSDAIKTLEQINLLASAGCDIIRVTYPAKSVKQAFQKICAESPLPVIADIHYDANLAIEAFECGADAIRINPGNMNNLADVLRVARWIGSHNKVVRIGVNSGSLSPNIRKKYPSPPPPIALVESALEYCQLFEDNGCSNIKVSLKSSNVQTTVEAYRLFAKETDHPLHIGVTEAGTMSNGIIKSATALGALLLEGLGDTLRVSLTAHPTEEVRAGIKILQSIGYRQAKPEIISCPTCGRTNIDLISLVNATEDEISRLNQAGYEVCLNKIALMGCVVNGPGEAKDADFGVAGGHGEGVIFRFGEVVKKVTEQELLLAIFEELHSHLHKK